MPDIAVEITPLHWGGYQVVWPRPSGPQEQFPCPSCKGGLSWAAYGQNT